jgi:hypothetical protein
MIGTGSGVIGLIATHGAPNALAGAITGVGLIGGGLVFRQATGRHQMVVGLNTAAAIFACAAIGAAAGQGRLLVAGFATLLTGFVLEIRHIHLLNMLDGRRWTGKIPDDDIAPDESTPRRPPIPNPVAGRRRRLRRLRLAALAARGAGGSRRLRLAALAACSACSLRRLGPRAAGSERAAWGDADAERHERDRDDLEVGQPERDADDRQAQRYAAEQVTEGEPPADEHDPDDVADSRADPRLGPALDLATERPQHVPADAERGDPERDRDDQNEGDQAG